MKLELKEIDVTNTEIKNSFSQDNLKSFHDW
jgi:hypothetical protein